MARLFSGLGRAAAVYDVRRLIDHRVLEDYTNSRGPHVICDIDKTYLETEFESITRMARIAFEDATDKVTVAGAPEVLSYVRWGILHEPVAKPDTYPYHLHFVSSSPPQLRAVLSEKLTLDGLDWSSDTFKNQAYNLRMRRMDLLRQHIGYKSMAILSLMTKAGDDAKFWMIGDNAESDPFIYLGVKLLAEGRLGAEDYNQYLRSGGLEDRVSDALAEQARKLPKVSVERILVRRLPGYDATYAKPWTDVVCYFSDFYTAMLQFLRDGLLPLALLPDLVRRFHNRYGLDILDMVRRAMEQGYDPALAANAPAWFQEAVEKVSAAKISLAAPLPKDFGEATTDQILHAMAVWSSDLHRTKLRRRGKSDTPQI